MFRIMKQIVAFSGEKKPVLTKAIIVSFIGAVFGALQFLALLLTCLLYTSDAADD